MQLRRLDEVGVYLAEKFATITWYEETDAYEGDLRTRDPRTGFNPIALPNGYTIYPRISFADSVMEHFSGDLLAWIENRGIAPARTTYQGRRMMHIINSKDISKGGVLYADVLCP